MPSKANRSTRVDAFGGIMLKQSFQIATIVYALLMTTVALFSCAAPATNTTPQVRPHIENAQKTTTEVVSGLGEATDRIDKHVESAEKKTPPAVLPTLLPDFTGIRNETGNIREMQTKLDGALKELDTATGESKKLEGQKTQLAKQVETLTEEKNSALRHIFNLLIILSVVGCGIAGVMVYTGNKFGITLGVGAVITLFVSIFISAHMMWFIIGGGVMLLLGAAVLVFEFWKRRKANLQTEGEKNKLEKVGTELVATIEANKMAMRDEARHYIFGNGALPGHVDIIQSPETKHFVRAARETNKVRLAPSVAPVIVGQGTPMSLPSSS
jgi:hypothetical protein